MQKDLLQGLHDNLWRSLRHIFNTDRVMLGVAYLVNFSAFVLLLALLPENMKAAGIALVCLASLNGLIFLSLRNSRKEVLSLIGTLSKIYSDCQLSKYFDDGKANYYEERYRLWLILVPGLMVFVVIIAGAIRFAT